MRARLVIVAALIGCGAPKVGTLRLSGAPKDALVTVDDRYIGKLGRLRKFGIKLPPGQHRLTIEADGFFPRDQIIDVPANGTTSVDIALEEVPD